MQNSVLKLTALAGVVGIGFLAVLQAQRGLNSQVVSPPSAQSAEQSHEFDDSKSSSGTDGESRETAASEAAPSLGTARDMPDDLSMASGRAERPYSRPGGTSAPSASTATSRFASAGQPSSPTGEPAHLPDHVHSHSIPVSARRAGPLGYEGSATSAQSQQVPTRSGTSIDGLTPMVPGRVRTVSAEPAADSPPRQDGAVKTAESVDTPADDGAVGDGAFGDPFGAEPSFETSGAGAEPVAEEPNSAKAADIEYNPFGDPGVEFDTEDGLESEGNRNSTPSEVDEPRLDLDGSGQPTRDDSAADPAGDLIDESDLQPFGEEPSPSPTEPDTARSDGDSGLQFEPESDASDPAEPTDSPSHQPADAPQESKRTVPPVEYFGRGSYESDPGPSTNANAPQSADDGQADADAPGFDPFASENDPFAADPGAVAEETDQENPSEPDTVMQPSVETLEPPDVQESDAFSPNGDTEGTDGFSADNESEEPKRAEEREPNIEEPAVSNDPFAAGSATDASSASSEPEDAAEAPASMPADADEGNEPPLKERPQIRQSSPDRADSAGSVESPEPAPLPKVDELESPAAMEPGIELSPVPVLRTPEDAKPTADETDASGSGDEASGDVPERIDAPAATRLKSDASLEFFGDGTIGHDPPDAAQRPQLTIEKLAPPNAVLGQPMVYSILIRNVGTSAAHQVTVEDQIPKGTQLQGTIPRAELVEKRLLWRLGTVQAGEEKKIQIRVVPIAEGQIGSIATVNFVAEVAAKTVIIAPRLRLEMSAPRQAKIGEPVVVNFKITNDGTGAASGVFLRDVIPGRLSHPDGNDLEYEVGTLPPRESRDVKLTLTAVQPGTAVNRAMITAEGGLSTEAQAEIEIIGSQFKLNRSGPSRSVVGRPAVFTNIVTNDLDDAISGAVVVETVPEGMQFVEASAGGQYDEKDRKITWRLEKIGPQARVELKSTLIPNSTGDFSSSVVVRDELGGEAEVTSQTTAIGFASLALDLTDVNGTVAVGEGVSVKLHVRNRGSVAAQNVTVKVIVPPEMQFVSAQGHDASLSGNEIRFAAIPSIPANSSFVLDLALTARKPGDARVRFMAQSEEMQRPLNHEESIVVFAAGQ